MKIHILGAPGSGVSSLGKLLAEHLTVPHFDTDDFHWFTDDELPFRRRRNPEHRRELLSKALNETNDWVLSGALCGWGDVFIPLFDVVLYMWAPREIRIQRITLREENRYGKARVDEVGDLHQVFVKFLDWAGSYDEPSGNLRSRESEKEWMAKLPCPVINLDGMQPLQENLRIVCESLAL
ncbi:MAG: AAA family ATPase [Saprospiraceae bacterium]|nr:hypothetical protein [Saprospiraceae bacterium]MCB9345382.1 hypothetical protein [Lewinellaceae bacterium]